VTDATHEEQLAERELSPSQAVFAGVRQPIVLILLAIAFFTTISGKPLDGFLMLTVATLLVWDAARSRLREHAGWSRPAAVGGAGAATVITTHSAPAITHATTVETPDRAVKARPGNRRIAAGLAWVGAALCYASVVGSFKRYSWPATIAVVALGCLAVAVGWQGPLRRRAALTGQALHRAWLWAVVLVAGGLWELSSLLQQPHLTTDSYAHPTISALTDPLLASHPGRSVTLGAWLLIGWFLVGR
jgi:hypothetical protein